MGDTIIEPKPLTFSPKIAIVASQWHPQIMDGLIAGALHALDRAGCKNRTILRVTGSWEIPLAIKTVLSSGMLGHDGAIALGCIMQGQTEHARLLAEDTAHSLMQLQLKLGKPIAYGILSAQSEEQAIERSGSGPGNRGSEAAEALLASLSVLQQTRVND